MDILNRINLFKRKPENLKTSSEKPKADLLWKLCKELWENAENKSNDVVKCKKYWNGELASPIIANNYFPDQNKTNCNIVKPIVETKLKSMLDAQFSICVVPDIGSFYDISAIKNAQAVADILNDELKNVFQANDTSVIDEQVARDGYIGGFGSSQVRLDTQNRIDGEIKIDYIPAENLRWAKGAKNKTNYWAFAKELPIGEAKALFGKNEDGTFNEELCKKIDSIAEDCIDRKGLGVNTGAVINYINEENDTAGRAYAISGSAGITSGRKVNLVYMYLLDDSVFAPEEKDDTEESKLKIEAVRAYPNGRVIVFSLSDKKVILSDSPAPEALKNLGNIDIFNATQWETIAGKGDVEDLIPIQDRINGLFAKYREKVAFDFDTIIIDSDFGIEDNAIVRGGLTKVDGYNKDTKSISEPLSNNGIEKAKSILEAINMLKTQAYEVARVNETMLYGTRQTGTTSADQVEALQESPMTDIRSAQRNFKVWKIGVAEKVLNFIVNNYSSERIIQLTSGFKNAKFAQVKDGENGKSIELYNEAMEVVESLKFNDSWKFKVDCIAGTEIPRTRKENALLIDKIAQSPIMQTGDIDLIELYLLNQDLPEARSWIRVLKEKQKKASENPPPLLEKISSNPQMLTAWGNFFEKLSGFSIAQGQLLQKVGLSPETDTIITAPAQSITAKSSADKIAVIAPAQISDNIPEAKFGYEQATDMQIIENAKRGA